MAMRAVILCGHGDLEPLTSTSLPKALLPVAGRPLVEGVLRWVEESALTDVLLLAPKSQQPALQHFVRTRRESALRISIEVHDEEEVEGTAQVLARAARAGHLKTDFVILPCDLALPPNKPDANLLASLIASHRAADHLVTSLMYERPAPKDDKAKREKPSLLTFYDANTKVLLDMKDLEEHDEDEITIRSSLFRSYPSTTVTTKLEPAHVYICAHRVLEILLAIDYFESIRLDFIPFLAKAQWQSQLLSTYTPDRPLKDVRNPQALALSHSSTTPSPSNRTRHSAAPLGPAKPARPTLSTMRQSTYGTLLKSSYSSNDVRPSDVSPRPAPDAAHWPRSSRIALHIWRPAIDGVCLRATTTSKYADLNRLALKAVAEPEGVMGAHVSQGEKTSVKKCAIGDHCSLAKYAKLAGCVLFEGVVVGESAKLDNCIIGKGARIGDGAILKDCEIGADVVVPAGAQLKGEQLSIDNDF